MHHTDFLDTFLPLQMRTRLARMLGILLPAPAPGLPSARARRRARPPLPAGACAQMGTRVPTSVAHEAAQAPMQHDFIPVSANLITWANVAMYLGKYQAQAWLFVYIDSRSGQPITIQAVREADMPAVFMAAKNPYEPAGWRKLELIDLVPDELAGIEQAKVALENMISRCAFLQNQIEALALEIDAYEQAAGLSEVLQ